MRRAPYAGLNRIRFQGSCLNPTRDTPGGSQKLYHDHQSLPRNRIAMLQKRLRNKTLEATHLLRIVWQQHCELVLDGC